MKTTTTAKGKTSWKQCLLKNAFLEKSTVKILNFSSKYQAKQNDIDETKVENLWI